MMKKKHCNHLHLIHLPWTAKLPSPIMCLLKFYMKAFDQMDHILLLNKLISFGIPEFIVKWIFSFLYQCKQRIKLNRNLSDWITLNGGTPHGTWLRPLSFIAFINGLIPHCSCHKFVNDVTLTDILKKVLVLP